MKPQVIPITPDQDEVSAIAATLTAALRENETTDHLFIDVRRIPWGYYVSAVPADGVAVTSRRDMAVTNSGDRFVQAEAEYRDALAALDRDLYDVLAMVARDPGLSDVEAEVATRAAIRAAMAGARDAAEQYCGSS
jgi:hypothetical protein